MQTVPTSSTEKRQPSSHSVVRKAFFLILGCASLLYAFYIWYNSFVVRGERFFSLFDDAMIAMRYAKNLADGHGLLWNAGEPPVEGYTNFLWTLYMAFIHLFPIAMSKTSLVVMATGAVILLSNLFVVKSLAEQLVPEDRWAPLAAVFLTAFYYPLIYWTLRGMEVGFLMLLINVGVLLTFRLERKWNAPDLVLLTIVAAAAILTRMDAVIPIGIVTLYILVIGWKQGIRSGLLVLPLSLLAVLIAHTVFRIHYYGDALPNTYYLKVSGVSLWDRLSRGLLVLTQVVLYHFWPVLLLFFAGLIRQPRQFLNSRGLFLLTLIGGQVVYSVYVGGDAWEWMHFANRYLTIITPLLFIVTVRSVVALGTCDGRLLRRLTPCLGLGLLAETWFYFLKDEKFAAIALAVLAVFIGLAGMTLMLPVCRTRLSRWPLLAPILLTAMVINFLGYSSWMMKKNNGVLTMEDAGATKAGLWFKRILPKDTTLGVIWAGATPYFSELRCVDLMGKSDSVIAKGKPRGPFWPGHNKWDYSYSIGKLQPDVIVSLWEATEGDLAIVRNAGYVSVELPMVCDGGYGPYGKNYWIKKTFQPRMLDALRRAGIN